MTADAVGGVFTYALELAEGLAELGIETALVLTGPPPDDEQRARLAATRLAAVEERRFALEWMDDPWDDVARTGAWLRELVARYRPEVVHLNCYSPAAQALGRPTIVVGHSCVLSWHAAVRRRPAGAEWSRYHEAVAAGVAGADLLVAPTRAMLADLHSLYRPSTPSTVIGNGLDAAGLRPLAKEPYVIGVGRVWDEAKNLGALARVAPRVGAPVVVAGDGSPRGRVSRQELRTLLGHAAIFAEPARYEPFGLAALEAAFSGCALVLGDIPTLREVWDDAAVYVDPFDDDALARVLSALLADDARRAELARAARERALTYSRTRMARAYADVYRAAA
jgi:glycosyltransferase involved in cell wall biosynthesis